jgi:hypothetical protein
MLPLVSERQESELVANLKAYIAKLEQELKLKSEKLVVSWFIYRSGTTVLHILVVTFKAFLYSLVCMLIWVHELVCECVYMLGIVNWRNWNKYLYFYLIVAHKKKILFKPCSAHRFSYSLSLWNKYLYLHLFLIVKHVFILILVWCILLHLCLTKNTSQLPLFATYRVFTVHNTTLHVSAIRPSSGVSYYKNAKIIIIT